METGMKPSFLRKSHANLLAAAFLTLLLTLGAGRTPDAFARGAWIDVDAYRAAATQAGSELPVDQLRQQAEKTLTQPIPKLIDKAHPALSGDKRDYNSLAIYWWPDPANPEGPYIRRDGKVNPEKTDTTRYDAPRLQQMVRQVRALARGYAVTGDERYARRAVAILDTWFVDPATSMHPNLRYAQTIPGRNKGNHSGIIETVPFIDLVDSLQLLEPSKAFTKLEQRAVKRWFMAYVFWLLTSEQGKKEAAAKNNHGDWYDAQVAVYAHYVGLDNLARDVLDQVPEKRLEPQLAADGSLPLELARTRPVNYSIYALRAFLTLARVGQELGVDLYRVRTRNGASLAQACGYILPYVKGEKKLEKPDIAPFCSREFLQALKLAGYRSSTVVHES